MKGICNNPGKCIIQNLPWGEAIFFVHAHWRGKRLGISGEYTSLKYAMKAAFRMVMMGADYVSIINWSNLPADED